MLCKIVKALAHSRERIGAAFDVPLLSSHSPVLDSPKTPRPFAGAYAAFVFPPWSEKSGTGASFRPGPTRVKGLGAYGTSAKPPAKVHSRTNEPHFSVLN